MYDDMYMKVLECWFNPESEPQWFIQDDEFDKKIRDEFYEIWKAGCEGLLASWRSTIRGRLAEIIVLDQFSRNLCRNEACAFTQDNMALILSQEAITHPEFNELSQNGRKFAIMPFMHSESLGIQKQSIELFEELGEEESTEYAYKHKDIIEKFGRFPHRNDVLNRKSTEEEIEFLKQHGRGF